MTETCPGVYHLEDRMGVHMTLLVGKNRALLLDTGYGLDNVFSLVREITDLPLTVVLSHGHHDHALGCQWFDKVFMHLDDIPVYEVYTGEFWRKSVLMSAHAKGLAVDDSAFLSRAVARPLPLTEMNADLGGLTVSFLFSPGHTPGSLMAWIPERKLLLTADNWNPVTWCFFPESMPVQTLLHSLRRALTLPFETVLCPHSGDVFARKDLSAFMDTFDEDALRSAEKTALGRRFDVDVRMAVTSRGHQLCFDYQKAFPGK